VSTFVCDFRAVKAPIKALVLRQGMSVHFAETKPSISELASFASKAKEIDLGVDIVELGDDLGMNLLANQNKVAPSPKSSASPPKQVSFLTNQSVSDTPAIQIKPVDDLEVVNLDNVPGASDIKLTRAGDVPFVLNQGQGQGQGGSQAPMSGPPQVTTRISPEEEMRLKQEMLTKIARLDAREVTGQRMTMANSLDEIKSEVDKRTDSRNLEASIRFQRNALMTFVTGVEMVNERFGSRLPVKPRLKGWSESVHTNVEDFDEIFEELYDMYKDKAKMHPLLRLAGTLGVSATMYHLTNTMAERTGIPGMADLLNEDPELQRQFAQKIAAKMGGGMGNFMAAAMERPSMAAPMSFSVPEGPKMPFNMAAEAAPPKARREMRGPSGVDDILRAFEAERAQTIDVPIHSNQERVFTPGGSGPDSSRQTHVERSSDPMAEFILETHSVGEQSMGSSTSNRRGRRRQPVETVGAELTLNV
jgi:hypothetical protein